MSASDARANPSAAPRVIASGPSPLGRRGRHALTGARVASAGIAAVGDIRPAVERPIADLQHGAAALVLTCQAQVTRLGRAAT